MTKFDGWLFLIIGIFGIIGCIINYGDANIPVFQYWGVAVLSISNTWWGWDILHHLPHKQE
ncbi:MAG: hypothetical protein WC878_04630 [Candidatus Paceibacterota bacterium]|jgi:hypothetical protein